MSKFFCDADCELHADIIKELDIRLIKMPYTLDGEQTYYDCNPVGGKEFFDRMRKGAIAKTQALNEYDYIQYFEPVFAAGEDILYVTFSHNMSGTFQSMDKAVLSLKEKYPERKFTSVDTLGISLGAGIIVHYAAKLHNEGASDEEVVKFVEGFRSRVRTYFTVDKLEYLRKGGRLSSFKATMGTIFDVKPVIYTNPEGKLISLETVKGRKKALTNLVTYLEKDDVDTNYEIYIIDADCEEGYKYVNDAIIEKYPQARVIRQVVGPVVGCHCGPDTIGVIFVTKG